MHFNGVAALETPFPNNYDFVQTMLSLYVAIVGTGLGLWIVARRKLGPLSGIFGGVVMGGAIAGMHYMGMEAMRGCGLGYVALGVAASVAVAMIASGIALWFALRKRGPSETLLGGVLLGLAIPSVHYTGMAATSIVPLASLQETLAPTLSQQNLGFIIASATFAICGVFLFLFSALAMGRAEAGS
jgi:NO-binding membrane sensor protein with MHYT domain